MTDVQEIPTVGRPLGFPLQSYSVELQTNWANKILDLELTYVFPSVLKRFTATKMISNFGKQMTIANC